MPDFQFKYGPSHRYWELALAQRADLWDGPDPLMHPNPQQGYYKARLSDGSWEAVSIYFSREKEVLIAQRGKRIGVPAEDAWQYCGANPISYEAYSFWWREGKFPGEIETPGIGHNSGEQGKLTADALFAKARALSALEDARPLDQDKADELANYDTACLKYVQALDKARKVEKHVFIDQGRQVDARYFPTIRELQEVRKLLKARLAKFFLMNPKSVAGGQLGSCVSGKPKRIAEIDDAVKFASFLIDQDHPVLMDCLEMIAKGLAKTGEEAPGVSFSTEMSA